jgi:Spy/CpxP family protein refolding chaperone
MLGIIIGTVCLFGLVKVTRGHHRRHHRHHQEGRRGRCGHRHHGRRGLLDALDLGRDQEREVRQAIDELRGRAREHRDERDRTRNDLATALRADSFDEDLFGELFVRHDDVIRELRKAGLDAFARIHAALDPDQRERIAHLVESGRRFPFGGPFRSAW